MQAALVQGVACMQGKSVHSCVSPLCHLVCLLVDDLVRAACCCIDVVPQHLVRSIKMVLHGVELHTGTNRYQGQADSYKVQRQQSLSHLEAGDETCRPTKASVTLHSRPDPHVHSVQDARSPAYYEVLM